MTSPKRTGSAEYNGPWVSVVADRLVAAHRGPELWLYDLHGPDSAPVTRIPEVVGHALQPTRLIVSDFGGILHRYEPHAGTWQPVARLPRLSSAATESPQPRRLLLSPSARHLLVETAWRDFLLDAVTGDVKRDFTSRLSFVRGNFGLLPSGDEVLFTSAGSYMSVQMVDCASGRLLHEFRAPSDWYFCHSDYALSADGTRLFTFGGPAAGASGAHYEVRVYDATPWTAGGVPAEGFPLPLVFRQGPVFDLCDFMLAAQPTATPDGAFTCVALVDLSGSPRGSADEAELRAELVGVDREIYESLRELPPTAHALLIRRVDPISGALVGWSVHEIMETYELHVHILSNHRVLLLNERIQIVDGLTGEVSDHGLVGATARWFHSAASSDGQIVVVWNVE